MRHGSSLVISLMSAPLPSDEIGAIFIYDAAHVSGMIAGAKFQPGAISEGASSAHILTSSSYKSFGGPAGGFILANDTDIATAIDQVVFPGLTANGNNGRLPAMAVATADLLTHGEGYAEQCVSNAGALAAALQNEGCHVLHADSHMLAIDALSLPLSPDVCADGDQAARLLERANILASAVGLSKEALAVGSGLQPTGAGPNSVRLGVQELTRRGMKETEMEEVARLLCRVLVKVFCTLVRFQFVVLINDEQGDSPEEVKEEVISLRHKFSKGLCFVN